ncbi:MAG: hypothetical protein OEY96_13660 [Gammaproteobacteria bacterium]|nr:hypothetical protein [Gammaproteobacteria bacterium]
MSKYQVMLRGENFEIYLDNQLKNLGFYTTRIVKGNSENEAEKKAVDLIKNDKRLLSMMKIDSRLTPKIYLETIDSVPWWKRTGGKGYTFWPMEGE